MSKGNTLETDMLKAILNGTAIANLLDNAASGPLANLYVALHTADPGEAGTQATSECTYGAYVRVAIARNPGAPAWTIAAGSASPSAIIAFAEATSGTETATHWSVGVASAGATQILYSGALNTPISIVTGTTPRLKTTSTITED